MSRSQRTYSSTGEIYYTLEKKWVLDIAAEGLAEDSKSSVPDIVYAHINKDLLSLQARTSSKNELFAQSFPPAKELRPFQKSLKSDADVVWTDDLMTFLYYGKKSSLEILKLDEKVCSLKGKLRGRKVCRRENSDYYLLVLDNIMLEVNVDVMMKLGRTVIDLPYSRIHDFDYVDNKLFVMGIFNIRASE